MIVRMINRIVLHYQTKCFLAFSENGIQVLSREIKVNMLYNFNFHKGNDKRGPDRVTAVCWQHREETVVGNGAGENC